jgi:hypothetical protein
MSGRRMSPLMSGFNPTHADFDPMRRLTGLDIVADDLDTVSPRRT